MNKIIRSGFTLVELMVVVAIIGILASVAVPGYKKYQLKSRTAEAKMKAANAYTAQQSIFSDFGTYASCLGAFGMDCDTSDANYCYWNNGYYTIFNYYTNATIDAANLFVRQNGGPSTCDGNYNSQFVGLKMVAGNTINVAAFSGYIVAACYGNGFIPQPIASSTAFRSVVLAYLKTVGAVSSSSWPNANIWTVDQNKTIIQVNSGM